MPRTKYLRELLHACGLTKFQTEEQLADLDCVVNAAIAVTSMTCEGAADLILNLFNQGAVTNGKQQ